MKVKSNKGISRKLIEEISNAKDEPKWMLDFRLKSFEIFEKSDLPDWVEFEDVKNFDFNSISYYVKPDEKLTHKWDDVPSDIRKKYEKLGLPEEEQKYLAGMGTQFESEMVYHAVREALSQQGVIFEEMSQAVKKYPDLIKQYFGKLVGPENNKYSALNGAVWSGGSLVYIPAGVYVGMPLHNFFQMGTPAQGQFERTIIIAEEGSYVEFLEGCVAPLYSETSIHAGVVEIFVKKDATVKFSTMQNWSKNVWNLVTKKAIIDEGGNIEWVDGNIGSGITMKYPSLTLAGRGAKGRILSLTMAGTGQRMDTGAKAIHLASDTSAVIESRSIMQNGGLSNFRGKIFCADGTENTKTSMKCSSLYLDDKGISRTYPDIKTNGNNSVENESSILKISNDQLLYLMDKGLDSSAAKNLIVGGFMEPFTNELPMEYAVEFNRLIEMEVGDEK